ncbi:5-formyltetrahydrofolate cyclo-ligase [Teichococcus oryzae]|uniref:5-formyltetrahydrofolate cyclo-ligase n=1 Tax=Teichococcus oryzae TaxID=1608942 RepID=A0A5B2TK64_9PROT|nr:5-formyltetrahydrofolate cyclo-ligase [Pseudoroseomonas oryzae]KAA2214897.1 5-formyltetrahydrofolate cyclo-ligase [Pseudoroseomonas oryzae]
MHDADPPALAAEKAALRRLALQRRALIAAPDAGDALASCLMATPPPPGTLVGGFWPMGEEVDLRPAMHALHQAGCHLALPVTPRRGLPLSFHRWMPGEALVPGRFGTSVPAKPGEPVRPDWLLVPLLAFDRRGFRLGYGGGYYDRTLAAWPEAHAVGVAFSGQEVPAVPVGPHDRPLAAIATEAGFILLER